MKKSILIICFCLVIFPTAVFAVCGGATQGASPDLTAYDNSYDCVNLAVNTDAVYNDTVNVPAGTGTVSWASQLTITKGIHLKGPGKDLLAVTTNPAVPGNGIRLAPDATSVTNGHVFEISGFTFEGGGVNDTAIITGQFGETGYAVLRIHDNIFNHYNSATGYGVLRLSGTWKGVIYSNTWTNNHRHCFRYLGNQATQWNWANEYTYGTANVVFIEDNTFNVTYTASSGGWSQTVVVRYNTFNNVSTKSLSPLWDVHGNQASGVCGYMGGEWYGNTLSGNGKILEFDMRGGRVMHWGNALTSGTYYPNVYNEYCNDLAGTCARDSDTQTFEIQNSYHFLNTDDGVQKDTFFSSTFPPTNCNTELAENAQFWNQDATFDGTTGVGVGTLAARPATCTAGVGYWVTDEGYWNGSNGATSDGRLYTCDAGGNAWSLYYTPYTYPHPLRDEGTAQATGTITANLTESGIVAGSDTIVISLGGANWEATAGDNNAITTEIIAGIDSAQNEAAGWDAVVKVGLDHTHVVRTSDTVLTITMPAFATYDITASETITCTIPASATDNESAIVATPSVLIAAEQIVVPSTNSGIQYKSGGSTVDYKSGGVTLTAP